MDPPGESRLGEEDTLPPPLVAGPAHTSDSDPPEWEWVTFCCRASLKYREITIIINPHTCTIAMTGIRDSILVAGVVHRSSSDPPECEWVTFCCRASLEYREITIIINPHTGIIAMTGISSVVALAWNIEKLSLS